MTKRMTKHLALAATSAVLLLAGCGGGSGGSSSAPPPSAAAAPAVPIAASQSVAGLIGWASTLAPDDAATPLATDSFAPPVDDTAQPMPV